MKKTTLPSPLHSPPGVFRGTLLASPVSQYPRSSTFKNATSCPAFCSQITSKPFSRSPFNISSCRFLASPPSPRNRPWNSTRSCVKGRKSSTTNDSSTPYSEPSISILKTSRYSCPRADIQLPRESTFAVTVFPFARIASSASSTFRIETCPGSTGMANVISPGFCASPSAVKLSRPPLSIRSSPAYPATTLCTYCTLFGVGSKRKTSAPYFSAIPMSHDTSMPQPTPYTNNGRRVKQSGENDQPVLLAWVPMYAPAAAARCFASSRWIPSPAGSPDKAGVCFAVSSAGR
mmetsp:Transcript_23405/g.62029  ORF Transcript_23405/g.62029 Transcript_23405/m.62029 type:complete len:290 (-) Transcript_23405:118-987(-)